MLWLLRCILSNLVIQLYIFKFYLSQIQSVTYQIQSVPGKVQFVISEVQIVIGQIQIVTAQILCVTSKFHFYICEIQADTDENSNCLKEKLILSYRSNVNILG